MSAIDFDSLVYKPAIELPPYIVSRYQKALQNAGYIRYEKSIGSNSVYGPMLVTMKNLEKSLTNNIVSELSDTRIPGNYCNVCDYLTGIIRSAKALPLSICTGRCTNTGLHSANTQPRRGPLMPSKIQCDTELLRIYSQLSENDRKYTIETIANNINEIPEFKDNKKITLKTVETTGGFALVLIPTENEGENEMNNTINILVSKENPEKAYTITKGTDIISKNIQKAEIKLENIETNLPEEIYTPNTHTITSLAEFCNVKEEDTIKAVMFELYGYDSNINLPSSDTTKPSKTVVFVAIRGDRQVNSEKLRAALGLPIPMYEGDKTLSSISTNSDYATDMGSGLFDFASEDSITERGLVPGFSGLYNLQKKFLSGTIIVMDESIDKNAPYIIGGNKIDTHIKNFVVNRDLNKKANVITADISEPIIENKNLIKENYEVKKGFLIAESIDIKKGIKFADAATKFVNIQYTTIRIMDITAILFEANIIKTPIYDFIVIGKLNEKDREIMNEFSDIVKKKCKKAYTIIDSRPKANFKTKLDCFLALKGKNAIVLGKQNQEEGTRNIEIYSTTSEQKTIKLKNEDILEKLILELEF